MADMAAGIAFSALDLSVVPVVTASGLTTSLPAGTVVAGFLDPVSNSRIFDPYTEGLAPQSGDATNEWLPSVKSVSAAQVTDEYWASVAPQVGGTATGVPDVGQVTLYLTPGSKNTVEAASVMTFKVSPQALVITCTTTSF